VQPGPVKDTKTVLGSIPVPAIVNVNAWPAVAGFGTVVMLVSCAPPVPDTVSVRAFEGAPLDPFCTVRLKLPADSVVLPLKDVAVLLVSALLETVQGVQPGPLSVTNTELGSNPLPAIVNVNA